MRLQKDLCFCTGHGCFTGQRQADVSRRDGRTTGGQGKIPGPGVFGGSDTSSSAGPRLKRLNPCPLLAPKAEIKAISSDQAAWVVESGRIERMAFGLELLVVTECAGSHRFSPGRSELLSEAALVRFLLSLQAVSSVFSSSACSSFGRSTVQQAFPLKQSAP